MKKLWIGAAALLVAACSQDAPPPAATTQEAQQDYVSGIDLDAMDASVRPGDDFFAYVNGAWVEETAMPADKSRYGVFDQLRDLGGCGCQGLLLALILLLALDLGHNRLETVLEAQDADLRMRSLFRHPAETLSFFGVAPGSVVVEALPGGGWYSKILIDYLGPEGELIGADWLVYQTLPDLISAVRHEHATIEDFDTRLVAIDSTLAGERKGHFCEQRQAWLEATLDAVQAEKMAGLDGVRIRLRGDGDLRGLLRLREEMVRTQLENRGIDDPRVLKAMRKVPRHLFVIQLRTVLDLALGGILEGRQDAEQCTHVDQLHHSDEAGRVAVRVEGQPGDLSDRQCRLARLLRERRADHAASGALRRQRHGARQLRGRQRSVPRGRRVLQPVRQPILLRRSSFLS